MLYARNTNLLEYDFFLIIFLNKPINRPIQTDLFVLVPILKRVKTEPNRTNEKFIGSNIFLTKN